MTTTRTADEQTNWRKQEGDPDPESRKLPYTANGGLMLALMDSYFLQEKSHQEPRSGKLFDEGL